MKAEYRGVQCVLAGMKLGEKTVIRQTISCDMCGTEKRATNHWYVALERDGELRLGTWAALGKRRARARHLCGQKCLHKLVDDFFVTRAMGVRAVVEEETASVQESAEATSIAHFDADFGEYESSARLIPTPEKPPRVNMDAVTAAAMTKSMATRRTPGADLKETLSQRMVTVPVPSVPVRAAERVSVEGDKVAKANRVENGNKLASERRRSEAWRREQAREAQPTPPIGRSAENTRLTPNRIEARLHPILRPRTMEA